jgi:hypothetical protein
MATKLKRYHGERPYPNLWYYSRNCMEGRAIVKFGSLNSIFYTNLYKIGVTYVDGTSIKKIKAENLIFWLIIWSDE